MTTTFYTPREAQDVIARTARALRDDAILRHYAAKASPDESFAGAGLLDLLQLHFRSLAEDEQQHVLGVCVWLLEQRAQWRGGADEGHSCE